MSTSQYTTLVHAPPRGHTVSVTGGGAQIHQVRQVSPGGAPQLIFKVNAYKHAFYSNKFVIIYKEKKLVLHITRSILLF